jgi:hypothetical protein
MFSLATEEAERVVAVGTHVNGNSGFKGTQRLLHEANVGRIILNN